MEITKYKLSELLTIKNGKDYKHLSKGSVPVFGSGGYMCSVDSYLYDKPSVLLPRKGSLSNIQYYDNGKFWTVDTCFYSKVNENVAVPYYIYRYLKNLDLSGFDTGASIPSMTQKTYNSIKVLLPSLPTQQKIASILSTYDKLIENNTKRIRLLEQMAENLYKEWFVRFRFPGHENVEMENGLPKGWKFEKLFEVADVLMGQSPESKYYNEENQGLPFHQGVGSYGDFYLNDSIYSTEGKRIAKPFSIIFSVRAPVGRININLNRIILGRGVASINHKNGYNAFLLWCLKDKFAKEDSIGNGSIFTSVTKDELLKQKITIPTRELLEQFNSLTSNIEKGIRVLTRKNALLTRQRDLLLPRLMSGKLEVKP